MEHNFLSERTKDYLNIFFKNKNNNDFIQEQKTKLEKSEHFFFCLPWKKEKDKKFSFSKLYEFDSGEKTFSDMDVEKICNLHYPETEDIEYSEYSNEQFFKKDLFTKEYKDGILAVSNLVPNKSMQVAFVVADCKTKNVLNGKTILSMYESEEHFKNYGQINWKDKKFDEQMILYFVFPKYSKNKAFKIILKNNESVNKLINYFRQNENLNSSKENQLFLRSKSETFDFLRHISSKEVYNKNYGNIKDKYFFLKHGYNSALIRLVNAVAYFDAKNNFEEKIENFKLKTDNKTIEELKEIYLKEIFPYEQYFEPYFAPQLHSEDIQLAFYKSVFIKFIILKHACNYNSLVDGTIINTDYKTENDCLLFWNKINLFELFFNLFNQYNTRLALNPEGIVNDLDKFDDRFTLEIDPKPGFVYKTFEQKIEESNIENKQYDFKGKHILQEAMDSSTGYLMPYDGAFEILHDPLFNFIRFREYEDFISIVIADKNERCLVEVFDKREIDFKYMLWNDLKQSEYHSEECVEEIYTKLATCIRDAKVLIERDSTMQYQGRRRPYGSNTNSIYHFYFPRVRYKRSNSKEQLRKERDFFNESRNFSGTRRAHVRKLPGESKPSKKQLLLAKQLDVYVPERHTFVQAAKWGENMTKREIRYRNTALNGLFYFDRREMSEAKKINQLSPLGFEEYSQKYIQTLGYEIKKKSNYDGGIDIRAVKILDNMQAEDLLVQCKHWQSPIPPGEIRDFKTACDLEQTDNNKKLMFITSSKFSPGAREIAEKFNITLIDGDDLIK